MVIGKDVYGNSGVLLIRKGNPLKQRHIDSLTRFGYPGIYIDDEISKGIDIPDVIDAITRNRASVAVQGLFAGSKFSGVINTVPMFRDIERILEDIVSQIIANKSIVFNMISLKTFDCYTYQHCVDVGLLSIILGKELKMKKSALVELGKAALFHDIGKMFISKNILSKVSQLSFEEYEEIKKHPQLGYDCLMNELSQSHDVCTGALHHHEKYEGSGYPNLASGDSIPLFARIIAVADTYDSITTNRIYKDSTIASEAYEYIMGNVKTHFDPKVVEVFVRRIPPFPVGSGVLLSNGIKVIVVQNRPNIMMRPLVKVIKETESDTDEYIDLALDETALSTTIVKTL